MIDTLLARFRTPPTNTVRIVTWNCRGTFRAKWPQLVALKPDVAVVQECEVEAKWPEIGATWHHRIGESPHKGLAVITFGDWHASVVGEPPADLRYFLPVRVEGPCPFNLLGLWAHEGWDGRNSYIGQARAAVERYRDWLAAAPSVVAGDWNSDGAWDNAPKGRTPFADTVGMLAEVGLVSAYHAPWRRPYGHEWHKAFHNNYRHAFHIDYCFVPKAWQLRKASIGGKEWLKSSDHRPVVVELGV